MLPIIAFVQSVLILGIIFILGSINVYVQDLEYIIGFILNMGMYATPIIYDISLLKNAGILYKLVSINPLTILVSSYRDIFMYHQWPNFLPLLLVFLFGLFLLIIGYLIFKRLEKGFAEEL